MANPLLAAVAALSIFSGGLDTSIYAQRIQSEPVPDCDLDSNRKTVLVKTDSIKDLEALRFYYNNAYFCDTQGSNLVGLDVAPEERVRMVWLKGASFLSSREIKRLTNLSKPNEVYIHSRSFGY